ncbi:MAG: copper resistance protein CopC [Actinomycetota bacterium]
MRGRFRRIAAVASMASLALALGAGPAFAHAALETTAPSAGAIVPTSPPAVELRFTEEVSIGLGGVRVIAAGGETVRTGEPATVPGRPSVVRATLPDLDDGTYVVTWRVLSGDSHPVRGAFTFSVGAATAGAAADRIAGDYLAGGTSDGAVDATYTVLRFLVFAAMALVIGLLVGATFVWRSALALDRVRRVLWTAWGVLLAGTLLSFLVQGPYAGGLGLADAFRPSLWVDVAGTRLGAVLLVRVGLVLALLPVLLTVRREPRPGWSTGLTLAALVGIAATPGLGGHAGVGPLNGVAILVDTLHVLAMGVWLGGLTLLVLLVTRADAEDALAVMPTWSRVATLAVLAVVLTGVSRGWRELGGLAGVLDTEYGRLLAIKVGLVLVALLVATVARDAVHRRWALDAEELEAADRERAERIAAGEPVPSRRGHSLVPNDDGVDALRYVLPADSARRRLLRSVVVEVVLLTVVLGVTALLVDTAPSGAVGAAPYSATLDAGPILADVVVTPARVGPNEVHLTLSQRTGRTAGALNVSVEFELPAEGIDPIDVPLRRAGVDHYLSSGLALPVAGDWRMTLKILTDPITEETATATVTIR